MLPQDNPLKTLLLPQLVNLPCNRVVIPVVSRLVSRLVFLRIFRPRSHRSSHHSNLLCDLPPRQVYSPLQLQLITQVRSHQCSQLRSRQTNLQVNQAPFHPFSLLLNPPVIRQINQATHPHRIPLVNQPVSHLRSQQCSRQIARRLSLLCYPLDSQVALPQQVHPYSQQCNLRPCLHVSHHINHHDNH